MPEVFNAGSDVGGQGLGLEVQAECLLRYRPGGFDAERRSSADKGLQPVAIVPDQQADACDDDAPQRDFNQARQALKQLHQGLQPLRRLAVIRGFSIWPVFAEAIARHRFPVLERWLFEDRPDAVPGGLTVQGLVQQAWAVG
ncbi:hypothetical protein D3C81_1616070 [compost metagenome]